MRRILALAILLAIFPKISLGFSSPELQQLWDIPLNIVKAKTSKIYIQDNVKVEEVYYYSREYQGKPAEIFGYLCYPQTIKQSLPAILVVHGGGGSAQLPRSIDWAKRGYVIFSIDLPGKGQERPGSRSTGPNMYVPILLKTDPNPSYNYLVHAAAATRNAISYLCQREEVDPERLGMVGFSWGGVVTLLTNGQDTRLKTAVNVFGSGYLPEGCAWQYRFDAKSKQELEEWYKYIDPKNFLKTQRAPILFVTGTNDHCYYLPAFQKSFAEVTAPKKLYLIPNVKHRFLSDTQTVVWQWLESTLKDQDNFPEIELLYPHQTDEKLVLPFKVTSSSKITQVALYYAQGQPNRFTQRVWQSWPGYVHEGIYYFSLPAKLLAPELMFFVTAHDNKGGRVSLPARSIFLVRLDDGSKSFALSSPIHQVHQHGKPILIVGTGQDSPSSWVHYSKENKNYNLIKSE